MPTAMSPDFSPLYNDDSVVTSDQLMNWNLTDDWDFPMSGESAPGFQTEFDLQNQFKSQYAFNPEAPFPFQNPSNLKSPIPSSIPQNWAPSNLRPVSNPITSANWTSLTSTMESSYRSKSPVHSTFPSEWDPPALTMLSTPASSARSRSPRPTTLGLPWDNFPSASSQQHYSPPSSSRSRSPGRRPTSIQNPWEIYHPPTQRSTSPPPSTRSRSPRPNSSTFQNPWDTFIAEQSQAEPKSQCPSSAPSSRPSSPQPSYPYPYPSRELSSMTQLQNTRDFITQLESSLPIQSSAWNEISSPGLNTTSEGYTAGEAPSQNLFQTQDAFTTQQETPTNPPAQTSHPSQSPKPTNSSTSPTEPSDHASSSSTNTNMNGNSNRRRLQNLSAQRAFRSRQKAHVATLEQEVLMLRDELKRLQGAYTSLAVEFAKGK